MLLISKGMYEAFYSPHKFLKIEPLDKASFMPNFYYFHLGAIKQNKEIVPLSEAITLTKNQRIRVFSLESFTLSDRIFSLIGPCSELICDGLGLRNSPTIDPGFSGSLEMVIENLTDDRITLEPMRAIGKAVFFDVSETMIDLDMFVQREKEKAAWITRKLAGEKIKEAGLWVEKMIDTEAPKDF